MRPTPARPLHHVSCPLPATDSHPLVAAAIAIGRMPGEPPRILPAPRGWLAWIIGSRVRRPLADPALEVARAISASLARGEAMIRRELMVAAEGAGWSRVDLRRAFPGASIAPEGPA